jgi:hypothetical protein
MGSIIDAHQYVMLGDEVELADLVRQGHGQEYIFRQLRERSAQGPRSSIPKLWQGRCKELRVIGVKPRPPIGWYSHRGRYRAGRAVNTVKALLEVLRVPMVFIHPLRNPYDIIAAWVRHNWVRPLEASAEMFFDTYDQCTAVRELGYPWLDIRLEDLIVRPHGEITDLCQFLGLEASAEYVGRCAKALWAKPRQRRGEVIWTSGLIARVAEGIAERGLLEGYTYDG